MKLRIKHPEGAVKVELPNDATLASLRTLTEEQTGISCQTQKLLGPNVGGGKPQELDGPDDTPLTALGIMSGDQVTVERHKVDRIAGSPFQIGDRVRYKATGEAATISSVHLDDPPDPYYTVLFENGSERQTTVTKLEKDEASGAPQ